MHDVKTEIEIEATPERVWSILLNFPAYSQWNPFVRSIEGVAETGERLAVSIQTPKGRGMTFRPTLLAVRPNQELRWRGRLFLPGIFDGEHYFQIVSLTPSRVKFIHGEKYSGLLVPFAKSTLDGGIKASFIAMNEALKALAERNTNA